MARQKKHRGRPRSKRPPTTKSGLVHVQALIKPVEYRMLVARAEAEETTVSDVIRRAIDEGLAAKQ